MLKHHFTRMFSQRNRQIQTFDSVEGIGAFWRKRKEKKNKLWTKYTNPKDRRNTSIIGSP